MTLDSCPFCDPPSERVFLESDLAVALWDGYPVTRGHALVIPRRHVDDWFEASRDEQFAILGLIDQVKDEIELDHAPDGYNIGINIGEAAGQTVFHLHVHVIPRYEGDAEDPRGGVRWIIPARAKYWDD